MFLLDHTINCKSRSDRVEIFPFYCTHFGKRNCHEKGIIKQRQEIIRQGQKPDRHVRVIMGGDINDVIKPRDIRFDFNEIADWVLEGDADCIRDKLNDIAKAQVDRSTKVFGPVRDIILGNIEANHDKVVRKRYNTDTHKQFCKELGIPSLTDEAVVRFRFRLRSGDGTRVTSLKLYIRHGYGSGRTAGAEPMKIYRMMADGVARDCDICFTGHTHTFCVPAPEPVLYVPNSGKLPPEMLVRYRYGANPGCWLLSHKVGPGGYESASCYPTRPIMTLKAVIWPFWHTTLRNRYDFSRPKIEIRQYTIL